MAQQKAARLDISHIAFTGFRDGPRKGLGTAKVNSVWVIRVNRRQPSWSAPAARRLLEQTAHRATAIATVSELPASLEAEVPAFLATDAVLIDAQAQA
jgi:hypothetical protein